MTYGRTNGLKLIMSKSKDKKKKAKSASSRVDAPVNSATGDETTPKIEPLSRKFYNKELDKLQFEMVRLQYCVKETGQRLVLIV